MKGRTRRRRMRALMHMLVANEQMEREANEVLDYWTRKAADDGSTWAVDARLCWARIELAELLRERRMINSEIADLRRDEQRRPG